VGRAGPLPRALLVGPRTPVGVGADRPRDGDERARLRHAPGAPQSDTQAFVGECEVVGQGAPATHRQAKGGDVAAPELRQEAAPHRGDRAGDRDPAPLDLARQLGGLGALAGEREVRAGEEAGVRQAPGIDVEHRDDRQYDVALADPEAVGSQQQECMQHDRAVAVGHAFGRPVVPDV